MVTGAGGRIGSEFARRLVGLKPARIVMVDRSEHDLSAIGDELQCVHQVRQGSTLVTKHLVDITDRAAISVLIGRTKPVAILHAATLREGSTPAASVAHVTRGNISGTRSLVEAAADRRVARFVLVSTDDAREPSNATGASMRVAEMIVADAARKTGDHFTSVRVGRLVGRSEAAIEALRSQLESGELVTVNASEPKCYLMNIAEASELVLEAAALAEPGHVYRLDQGTPRRVGDVARDLIRLLGADPDLVPIRIVGRPPSDEPGHRGAVRLDSGSQALGFGCRHHTACDAAGRCGAFPRAGQSWPERPAARRLARYVRFIDSKDTPYLDEHGLRPMVPVPVTTSASEPSRGLFDGRRSGTLAGKVAILPVSAVPAASETSSAAVVRVRSRGSQPK